MRLIMRHCFYLIPAIFSCFIFFLGLLSGSNAHAVPSREIVQQQLIEKTISEINLVSSGSGLGKAFQVSSQLAQNGLIEQHSEIIPEYSNDSLRFILHYDQEALKNPELLLRDLAFLSMISKVSAYEPKHSTPPSVFIGFFPKNAMLELTSPHPMASPYSMAELLSNAKAGSLPAQARLKKLQIETLEVTSLPDSIIQTLELNQNVLQKIQGELQAKSAAANLAAEKYLRQQQARIEQWRSESQVLNQYEAQKEMLNDLILKNDRTGVRKMLEAYLPWAVMEPVEAKAWRIWLEAIEQPDWTKTTVAFRGLDYTNDKVQRLQTPTGEQLGFMSTLLTRNQGSYTRRLRSLNTSRLRNGSIRASEAGEAPMVQIVDQMFNHARRPDGSSFLSFTFDPQTAFRFVGVPGTDKTRGGILAVKMDSRRLIPNLTSRYRQEIELIAPLIVFPDEVLIYRDSNDPRFSLGAILVEVYAKTGIDFSQAVDKITLGDGEFLNRKYIRMGHEFLRSLNPSRSLSPGLRCQDVLL